MSKKRDEFLKELLSKNKNKKKWNPETSAFSGEDFLLETELRKMQTNEESRVK